MIQIQPVDPRDPDVSALIAQLDEYTQSLYPPESNYLDSVDELKGWRVLVLGAFDCSEAGEPRLLGCGAVKQSGEGTGQRAFTAYGELKRIFVLPEGRGKGVGTALIKALENHLLRHGVRVVRLETGIHQREALALYQRCGYRKRECFGNYQPNPHSIFMEKMLTRD